MLWCLWLNEFRIRSPAPCLPRWLSGAGSSPLECGCHYRSGLPVSSDVVASWPRSAWFPQEESSHSANHWLTVKFLGGCVRLDTALFDRRETYARVQWGPGTSAPRLARDGCIMCLLLLASLLHQLGSRLFLSSSLLQPQHLAQFPAHRETIKGAE